MSRSLYGCPECGNVQTRPYHVPEEEVGQGFAFVCSSCGHRGTEYERYVAEHAGRVSVDPTEDSDGWSLGEIVGLIVYVGLVVAALTWLFWEPLTAVHEALMAYPEAHERAMANVTMGSVAG